jgi:hypothetical protein
MYTTIKVNVDAQGRRRKHTEIKTIDCEHVYCPMSAWYYKKQPGYAEAASSSAAAASTEDAAAEPAANESATAAQEAN